MSTTMEGPVEYREELVLGQLLPRNNRGLLRRGEMLPGGGGDDNGPREPLVWSEVITPRV